MDRHDFRAGSCWHGKNYTAKEMKHTSRSLQPTTRPSRSPGVPKVKVGVVGEIYVKYTPAGQQ